MNTFNSSTSAVASGAPAIPAGAGELPVGSDRALFDCLPCGVLVLKARSHPDDAAQVQQALDQARLAKQPYYYRHRIYWPTGEEQTLEAQGSVVCDAPVLV